MPAYESYRGMMPAPEDITTLSPRELHALLSEQQRRLVPLGELGLPLTDGGFSTQYSPLMPYREGIKGVDPAAEQPAGNILSYALEWQPGPERTAVYAGLPVGREHL